MTATYARNRHAVVSARTGSWPVTQASQAIRRNLKALGFTALGLLALAAVLCVIALLVNAHDEPLAPEARALLSAPANPYGPADNIYVALQGFDAPPAESVIAAGEARIEQYNRRVDAALRDPSPANLESLAPQDAHRLLFKGDVSFIQPLESSVWNEAP